MLSGRGPEQQSKGVDTVLAFTNLDAGAGQVGKADGGYGCRPGQGNGQGGREHGQKADQLPGYRRIDDPAARAPSRACGASTPPACPGTARVGVRAAGRLGPDVKTLLVFGSNAVGGRSSNARNVVAGWRRWTCWWCATAFENDTSRARRVPAGHAVGGRDRHLTNLEGRVILRRQVRSPRPGSELRPRDHVRAGRTAGRGRALPVRTPTSVFTELRRATAGGRADYAGMSHDRIRDRRRVCWPCPDESHPGTPRLFAECFAFPDGEPASVAAAPSPAELPDAGIPALSSRPAASKRTTTRARRRGGWRRWSTPSRRPGCRCHPALASRLGVADGDRRPARQPPRRGGLRRRPQRRDPPGHGVRAVSLGRQGRANILTMPALDPTSRMPEFKVCAVRVEAVLCAPSFGSETLGSGIAS